MKPHPRIRKAVKWGGATLTVLLVVVWIGSGWWFPHWSVGGPISFTFGDGCACIQCRFPQQTLYLQGVSEGPHLTEGVYIHLHYEDEPSVFECWFSGGTNSQGWWLHVPLWIPALCALLVTALAFRLDTFAHRREREGKCPNCHYSLAGLPPNAPCPECGAANA